MPKVSVIVPIYKVEQYLPRCIDSILGQSCGDYELILVDDGSPDNCGVICDAYAARDERIRVIHQENAKLSAARNAGMDVARGEWLAFVDSDDWVHKDYLKLLLSGAQEDSDLVICGFLITDRGIEEEKDYARCVFKNAGVDEIEADHYSASRVWGRIYRRSTVGARRFISGTEPTEDICFNELLFREDMKIRITDAKLYFYYTRPDSAIHSHLGRGILNSVSTLLARLKEIDEPQQRKRIITRCYKGVLSARYGEMFTDDYADVLEKCRELLRRLAGSLPELDPKNRLIMRTLAASPALYRAWRIHDDPSLLEYEKRKKQERKERRAAAKG